jgi:hypothetical protein
VSVEAALTAMTTTLAAEERRLALTPSPPSLDALRSALVSSRQALATALGPVSTSPMFLARIQRIRRSTLDSSLGASRGSPARPHQGAAVTEPIPVAAADFFEFIRGTRLAVILVSVHSVHTFNSTLAKQLVSDHESIALGTIDLTDLLASGGPALRFLHQGLRLSGAPSAFGVLPGYYLFRSEQLVAWDAGLPSFADVTAIARSALLGAVWSSVSGDVSFVRQALRLAADQAAGERVAISFRSVIENPTADREAAGDSGLPPVDDVYWAYQVLGVLPMASDREVHEAWRRKRRDAHPDHAVGDAAEFERRSRASRDINRARDIIVDYRSGGARRAS